MDVLEPCCELLTNRDVLEFLKANSTTSTKKPTNLATISYETITYLETTPAHTSTSESIKQFQKECRDSKFNLSRIEIVQLANLHPENETELNLIIDNFDERFNEEQKNHLINSLKATKVYDPSDDSIPRKKLKSQ